MAESMNIYQKLAKVRKQVEVIQKNRSGYGYKYVTEDEILAKVSVFMHKYGLSLIPNIRRDSTVVSPYTYKKTKVTHEELPRFIFLRQVLCGAFRAKYSTPSIIKMV